MTIELVLPYPPSNNRYYRHSRGRNFISEDGKRYRLAVLMQRPRTGWPLEGRLAVVIEVYPQRARSIDLDNIPKAVLDSLQNAKIFVDDNAIDQLHLKRFPKVDKAHIRVIVARIEDVEWASPHPPPCGNATEPLRQRLPTAPAPHAGAVFMPTCEVSDH